MKNKSIVLSLEQYDTYPLTDGDKKDIRIPLEGDLTKNLQKGADKAGFNTVFPILKKTNKKTATVTFIEQRD